MRSVAKEFRTPLSVVQRWVAWAAGQSLNAVDWAGYRVGQRRSARRTSRDVEQRVLKIRKSLRDESALGEYGASAIRREMEARRLKTIPSLRTIGRILERSGAVDGRRRRRYPSPLPGWFLPHVASGGVKLDSFDIVEDLVIRGGLDVNVLTAISLHGGLCPAWPEPQITAKFTVDALVARWRRYGPPGYVKFDNDTVFQGPHHFADCFGRVVRMSLSLGVTPVFAPPGRHGFQPDIESFNRRWQDKVWNRFQFATRSEVVRQTQPPICKRLANRRLDVSLRDGEVFGPGPPSQRVVWSGKRSVTHRAGTRSCKAARDQEALSVVRRAVGLETH